MSVPRRSIFLPVGSSPWKGPSKVPRKRHSITAWVSSVITRSRVISRSEEAPRKPRAQASISFLPLKTPTGTMSSTPSSDQYSRALSTSWAPVASKNERATFSTARLLAERRGGLAGASFFFLFGGFGGGLGLGGGVPTGYKRRGAFPAGPSRPPPGRA